MSEFTLSELREAEIVPQQGGPNAWLVRFGENDYRMVNRTPKHRLLLEDDVLERAEDGDTQTLDGGETHVTFTADVDDDRYTLTVNGNRLNVPADYEDEVLEAYADGVWGELRDIHTEIVENRVRVGLMDRFMPRFAEARDEGRLRKSDDGWVIDETFVVKWNGENYLTENVDAHVVESGSTVRADETPEARQLSFDLSGEFEVPDPSGTTVELSTREAKFLATVECLLSPQEYLRDNDAKFVERAVENVQDPIASLARTARVDGFTDEKSGLYHGHDLQKHRLGDLGVTEEAKERLFYNSHDHAGVHEMKARRPEFENAPFSVFTDAPNDSTQKWDKIESTSRKAPIPQRVRSDIDSRFQ
jgi:hypothetical protein